MGKENHLFWQMGDNKSFLVAPTNQSIPVNFNHHASKTTEFNHQDNMSESCGSNGFPNAEGRKQTTNKRRTRQEFEEDPDEALSTTQHSVATCQQPYEETVPDSQQMWETQKLYIGSSQCQDSIPDFQPMWRTEDQFQVNPEVLPYVGIEDANRLKVNSEILPHVGTKVAKRVELILFTTTMDDNLDRPIVRAIVEVALIYSDKINQMWCTQIEALFLAEKIKECNNVEVDDREVRNVMNLLRVKFKNYCLAMQQGMAGLRFSFDDGTISKGDVPEENKDLQDGHWASMVTINKHVILYFYSLKE